MMEIFFFIATSFLLTMEGVRSSEEHLGVRAAEFKQQCLLLDQISPSLVPGAIDNKCDVCICEQQDDLCPDDCSSRRDIEKYCRTVAYGGNHDVYNKFSSSSYHGFRDYENSNNFNKNNNNYQKSTAAASTGGGKCSAICPSKCFISCQQYVSTCCPCGDRLLSAVVFDKKQLRGIHPNALNSFLKSPFSFNDIAPTLPNGQVMDTTDKTMFNSGFPVYGSLAGELGSWVAGSNTGLYLFFNQGQSSTKSAFYLWRREDFNGSPCTSNAVEVCIDTATSLDSASTPMGRIILKTASGWIISNDFPFDTYDTASCTMLSDSMFEPWSEYNPYVNNGGDAGEIEGSVSPDFSCVEWAGFWSKATNDPTNNLLLILEAFELKVEAPISTL